MVAAFHPDRDFCSRDSVSRHYVTSNLRGQVALIFKTAYYPVGSRSSSGECLSDSEGWVAQALGIISALARTCLERAGVPKGKPQAMHHVLGTMRPCSTIQD